MKKNIDDIILQYSTRGMDKLKQEAKTDSVYEVSKVIKGLKGGVIFLYTGFYVAGFAETDGPLGTYFLARSLKDMGFYPLIVTDKYCKNFFKEIGVIYADIEEESDEYFEKLLDKYAPTAHISIERCGRDEEGRFRNHRLDDISKYTAKIDRLFELGSKRSVGIAVGDGGNEIGMGKYKEYLKKAGINYSVIEADYTVVASVSNWGAYGLIAGLRKESLPSFEEADDYLGYIVSLGAVDGISKKNEKSVDAKEWQIEKEILENLRKT